MRRGPTGTPQSVRRRHAGSLMPSFEQRQRAAAEAVFCEAILGKSKDNVLRATLGGASAEAWEHYPPGDVFDADSGSQWYLHRHPDGAGDGEPGHFHCFIRPDGVDGPLHHLIAIGVDARGRIRRLFTVNHWVVGDDFVDADTIIPLLSRFDVQLARPDYLVNRWLTAVIALYEEDIAELVRERDRVLASRRPGAIDPRDDRSLEVLSEAAVDLRQTAIALGVGA